MSVQTDLNWQLAKQKGNLVGYWTKEGQLVRNDLPSWEERKLMRTDANGELVYRGKEAKKRPGLIAEPSKQGLDNEDYRGKVKGYADEWRTANKRAGDQTLMRGLKEEVLNP